MKSQTKAKVSRSTEDEKKNKLVRIPSVIRREKDSECREDGDEHCLPIEWFTRSSPIRLSPLANFHCTFANTPSGHSLLDESPVNFRQLVKVHRTVTDTGKELLNIHQYCRKSAENPPKFRKLEYNCKIDCRDFY